MVILCAPLAHIRCGDWRLIENGTSKAVYGMTAVPVKGKEPDAAATTAADGDTPTPTSTPASTPAPAETTEVAGAPAVPGPGKNPEPTPEAEPVEQPDAAPSAEPTSAAKPEAGPGPQPEPVKEPEPKGKSEREPESEPAAERELKAEPEPATELESEPEPEPAAERELKAEPEPRGEREPVPVPASKPEPAAERAPKSEPTAEPDPEPAADREPKPEAVPESDAERTSTFIALKALDEDPPAPVSGPAPAPVRVPSWAAVPAAAPDPVPGPAPQASAPQATAEQPLPPLDLLAQLTNTPPPPETAARTAARRVRIWVPLFLLLAAVLAVVQALRPVPAAALVGGDAASSVTLDGRFDVPWPEKGQAAVRVAGAGDVGTFGEQKPVPTASVAKVMTAYVILKGHPLKKGEAGPLIEVDAKAVADGTSDSESRIENLAVGNRFSQQDMLKMLMIPSGNNIARLLARWDTGSADEAAFVEKMNAEAKALGMESTTYTDPSGLDAKTVSTAVDQLKLAEAVMQIDAFRAIVMLPSAPIPGIPDPLINNNGNLLLSPLSIKGIKTGSSSAAGGTLMWAAYKTVGDKTPMILGTMLDQHVAGADPNGANSLILVKENSKKVIEAVREALASAGVVKKGQVVGYVDDGLGTRTPVVATKDAAVVAVPGQKVGLTLAGGEKDVPHEAKAGTEIGVLTIGTGPGAQQIPVALGTDLSGPSLGAKLTRLR
ncbi:D-alanyl-D-alanine carboxypeptidase family protein [Streptomyces sp. NBC_00503]|uniref:D-alanyl-D-alanine carboxypeptidase family protein n=1 Tax=Streptomyces sp. NBC_00503 TaxID=2903659 RepID=UPI002E7FBC3A|nr:D-alanyl-D-alanine carboxypeptidase [Streptomyces sp. NBC_00503]WUD85168.1 D-alanyl-D-alanine carboxypeptidase [Streptomyces sp. NBC_00503]